MELASSATASIALILFVILGLVMVATLRPVAAALMIILGASLFLPVNAGFDFPMIPPLGRRTLPYLILLVGILLRWPRRVLGIGLGRGPDFLVLVLILTPLVTSSLNQGAFSWGPRDMPGLSFGDGVSVSARTFLNVGLPFLVGRIMFKSSEDLRKLMTWLVGAGLIYSVLALVEIRLSPQLHHWVYGYHPNEFRFNLRWGGFRPMLFLPGGIAVGLFMASTTLAAFSLGRLRTYIGFVPSRWVGPYLLVILVLCKSVAAIVYGFVLGPLVALLSPRQIHRLALAIAALALLYPMLRTLELVPTRILVDTVSVISEDRAQSLNTRFENEVRLLDRSSERLFFGWGGYARGRVFDESTGQDITRSDGQWMILLSTGGLVEWACYFLLLLWPVMLATRRLPRLQPENQILLSGLMLIVSLFALDQLINGFYLNMCFALSGAAVTFLGQFPESRDAEPSTGASPAGMPRVEPDPGAGSLSGGLLRTPQGR